MRRRRGKGRLRAHVAAFACAAAVALCLVAAPSAWAEDDACVPDPAVVQDALPALASDAVLSSGEAAVGGPDTSGEREATAGEAPLLGETAAEEATLPLPGSGDTAAEQKASDGPSAADPVLDDSASAGGSVDASAVDLTATDAEPPVALLAAPGQDSDATTASVSPDVPEVGDSQVPAEASAHDAAAEAAGEAPLEASVPAEAAADASAAELPAAYDARSHGLVSPVRLQDPWGACWAFGSLAAMEANLVKQGIIDADTHLSPRHLIYFAGTPVGSEAGSQAGEGQHPDEWLTAVFGDNAVFELGGHAFEVASALSSGEGVALEADYPYRNEEGALSASGQSYDMEGTWALPESARYDAAYGLRNMLRLPNPGTYAEAGNLASYAFDADALVPVKQAILDYGAVSVSYYSSRTGGYGNSYDLENASFFTDSTTRIDHDVCIVGWDDSFPAERFTTGTDGALPEGDGAWIVKNSWGSASSDFPDNNAWGQDGYGYLSYYDRSATGFTAWEMMSLDAADATSITHQYDYMGRRSNSETRVDAYSPQSYANVFTAAQNEQLSAVGINTYAPRTDVTIELYALDVGDSQGASADPTKGSLLATQQLICSWAGYHRIALDKAPVLAQGQRFAVVVSMAETSANGTRVPVASIEAGNNADYLAIYGLTHYDTVVVNAGESFVLADLDGNASTPATWIDGVDFAELLHAQARDGAFFGNASIKVFANPSAAPVEPEQPQDTKQPQDLVQPGDQKHGGATDFSSQDGRERADRQLFDGMAPHQVQELAEAASAAQPDAAYLEPAVPSVRISSAHQSAPTGDGSPVALLLVVLCGSAVVLRMALVQGAGCGKRQN